MTQARHPVPSAIAEAAADWIIRRDSGELTAEEERAFRSWIATPAHRDALARLEKVWGLLDAEDPQAETPPPPPLPAQRKWQLAFRIRPASPPSRKHRGRMLSGAMVAALALVVLGTLQDWPLRLRADAMTGVGERRKIILADGSSVQLDSASAIALDYTPDRRTVRLLAGAALFEVAPDRARPFTVDAEGGSVTALGTAFVVRDENGRASVTVTKHRVRVEGGGRATVVGEGQRAAFSAQTLRGPCPARGDAAAFTRGRLVVVDRPLGQVVARIGRYRHGYVTVSGPAAAIRVSGVYDLDHPLETIENIRRSHGLVATRLSDRFIILHR
ncbi:FecR family protein [Novosphingobium sp. 9]|uniref:FecR family protein n=1 Tax=Novosphingobium sp. 9 TaxID=2025349 RepID=UPI0021B6C3A2|nr:FecR family protein [Novosphingobium sp. 9]